MFSDKPPDHLKRFGWVVVKKKMRALGDFVHFYLAHAQLRQVRKSPIRFAVEEQPRHRHAKRLVEESIGVGFAHGLETILKPKLSDSMFQDRQEVVPGTNKQAGSTLLRNMRRLSPNG